MGAEEERKRARARIVFDDPLAAASADDGDEGWGERPARGAGGDPDPDVARFLAEKPPHHL